MVLIASPKEGVRKRWRQALERITAVQEVATRAALERSLADLTPAVLLLDLAIPQLGGISGLRALQRRSRATRIILFTGTPDEEEGIAALLAGARGYVTTGTDPALIRKAVETVQKGEIWVRRDLVPHLLEELTNRTNRRAKAAPAPPNRRLARLTPREREIVYLVGGGHSNKEIANELNVGERTVKAHMTAIFRKVGVSDRLRLALFVAEHLREAR
jgi:DNA-binding NarL/FixJ family response regulator